jgi:hypothetical protein
MKTITRLLNLKSIDDQARSSLYANTQLRAHRCAEKKIKSKTKYGRQTTRANHPADTPKQYWKVSLYYAFIDHMIMELESRLIKSENRFYAQYLLPRVIGNITNEQIATLYETYQTYLTCNLDEFKREIAR